MAPSIEQQFQLVIDSTPASLGPKAWYLLAATTLIVNHKPDQLGLLYDYAAGAESPLSAQEKEQLPAISQDVLAKAWTLVGIPSVVVAASGLAKRQGRKEGDGGEASTWQPPSLTPTNTERGTEFMQALYKTNLSPIFASLGAYGPFVEWVDRAIVYGLFLSDLTLLSAVESELVTLTAIMCQGLKAPTLWHLRGLRRLGVSEGDVEAVQRAVEGLMVGVGGKVDGWARVRDVEAEV